jgi:hypothetical protein
MLGLGLAEKGAAAAIGAAGFDTGTSGAVATGARGRPMGTRWPGVVSTAGAAPARRRIRGSGLADDGDDMPAASGWEAT